LADVSVYVMTPEFGAPSQLEKIDMLDFADLVVLNKFDKRGAEDALREVRKAYQRNRKLFHAAPEEIPVFATSAHRFQDKGTNVFFNALFTRLQALPAPSGDWAFETLDGGHPEAGGFLPAERGHYLLQISGTVNAYHEETAAQTAKARSAEHCYEALRELGDAVPPKADPYPESALSEAKTAPEILALRKRYNACLAGIREDVLSELRGFDALRKGYTGEKSRYRVRDREIAVQNFTPSLSELPIPKVALPSTPHWDQQVEFLRSENAPGRFPFTSGVFPFKREGEDPTRMFAGEGMAERTNARFHFVSQGQPAVRLSTAFDSVTLYGADPHTRPDIYGKIGNSGVSICCLDDAKRLYSGFDLCAPTTSVSMTINGPAPMILAYFFNTAVDGACERWLKQTGAWEKTRKDIENWFRERNCEPPRYRSEKLPDGHDGSGLGFLGLPADQVMEKDAYARIRDDVLHKVRGTVQADILKEDQAQNTCIFSTEFALRLMGDMQQFFIDRSVRNFYSVSISGYHIAEAGANPITQLALTLANGFTFVEYYRSRGMDVNAFAPNLSFFFSNGLDPEYGVIGRVARRIWALAMKGIYGADERSQKLKYHIQTSGRSLHAQEVDFNDIRTTLQALLAINDNCNSLHTNAYDEAITTPTEDSVRRAIAIQLIINREFGAAKNENPLQGSYFYEYLTRLVEKEVLRIFEELDARGGVMGAMETNYQRSRIQEESLLYERKKHSGELPIIGVNTFQNPRGSNGKSHGELIRSTDAEKKFQVAQIEELKRRFPNESAKALDNLKRAAVKGGNLFGELMETAKVCSLGAISNALFVVGGAYRRSS
jgi:methylmalonyl-CoA mutase